MSFLAAYQVNNTPVKGLYNMSGLFPGREMQLATPFSRIK